MLPHPDDTIAALSSVAGPGLRAIVRVTGPKTRDVVGAVFTVSREPQAIADVPKPERLRLAAHRFLLPGSVRLSGVHAPLPADLYFWPAPHTYTGQDLAELHTVSSPPLVERLVADLLAAGSRPAKPGEFTLRAFLAGKKDLTQAEAVLAVIDARSDDDLTAALGQLAGGVTRPLDRLRDDLLNLLADVEAALDFADEDIEFVPKPEALSRIAAGMAHLTNLRRQLDDRAVSGRAVRVAVVGHPNAGKSSLFNALTNGASALISPDAGTTRDYLMKTIDLDGVPAELIDTAGWESAADTIAEQAQRLGRQQADRADVIVWCVPAGQSFDPADATRLARTGAEVLRVRTKVDLLGPRPPERSGVTPLDARDPRPIACSVVAPAGTAALRSATARAVSTVARPALAPSQSRCRHHVGAALANLQAAHHHALFDDPPELLALALRTALDQVGEMAGTVYTNDLLDRIFSRFCIGK